MKSIKHIGIASALALVISSSALAGDISGGIRKAGDISGGKAAASAEVSAAKAPGDISGGKYAEISGGLIQIVLAIVVGR